MVKCEDFLQKIVEENPNITDKMLVAKLKELKDGKGKRLYKTVTIKSRVRQFRSKEGKQQAVTQPIGEHLKSKHLEMDAKSEVETAFGERKMTTDVPKKVEPQETEHGHIRYDGRTAPIESKVDALLKDDKRDLHHVVEDLTNYVGEIDKKLAETDKELLQLKERGGPPVVEELVDVQLNASIVDKLSTIESDNSLSDINDTVSYLINKKSEVTEVKPDFLEKLSLNKKSETHGKLSTRNNKWRFVKRARPIVYGVGGAVAGGVGVFALLVLLKLLELLPWF